MALLARAEDAPEEIAGEALIATPALPEEEPEETPPPTQEPTEEPTEEQTVAPTDVPEPIENTPEATADSTMAPVVATESPAPATEQPENTPQTATDAPEASPAPIDEVAMDASLPVSQNAAFVSGWVALCKPADLFRATADRRPLGRLTQTGEIFYATDRVNAGGERDCVSIALNLSGERGAGFVDAASVRPLSLKEVDAYLGSASADPRKILYDNDVSYPLLPTAFIAAAVETEPQGLADAAEQNPQMTGSVRTECTKLSELQSAHPYAAGTDIVWTMDFNDITSLTVTFSANTMLAGTDALIVGGKVFFGGALAGQTVSVPGDSLRIKLSGPSGGSYGFKVTKIRLNGFTAAAPAQVRLVVKANRAVDLQWDEVDGANCYQVYRSPFGADDYQLVATTEALQYVDNSTLDQNGTKFSYKVQSGFKFEGAVCGGGESEPVHCVLSGGDQIALRLRAVGTDQIALTWDAQPNVARYQIYRGSTAAQAYSPLKAVTGGATGYIDTVKSGGACYYRIAPIYNENGLLVFGQASAAAFGQRGISAPAKPTVAGYALTQIKVSWPKVSGASSYTIYRSTKSDSDYKKIGTSETTSYIDTKAVTDKLYFYKVTATGTVLGKSQVSDYSPYSAGLTTVASTLAVQQINVETVQLDWTQVKGASGYVIYQKAADAAAYTKIKTVAASTTDYKVKQAQGKMYLYAVAPTKKVGATNYVGRSSAAKKIQLKLQTTYRALLIGNVNYVRSTKLLSSPYDVAGMKRALSDLGGTKYTTIDTKIDLTASGIIDAIRSTFKNATSSDVSLFYFTGHGVPSGSYAGSICGYDEGWLSPRELRAALDEIPGKKIVFVSGCGSGAMISEKSTDTTGGFADNFVSAFENDGATDKVFFIEDDDKGPYASKVGELAGSDYFVMTSAKIDQLGWSFTFANIFTWHLCQGLGYDYLQMCSTNFAADANKDKAITMKELYRYVAPLVAGYGQYSSDVRVYPSVNSTTVLFRK